MNFKIQSMAFAMISFFSMAVFAEMTDFRFEPKMTFAIKGNCKNSIDTYQCKGGFKVPALLKKWKKDSSQPGDYYEYEDLTKFITFDERAKLLSDIMAEACPSQTYAMYDTRDIRFCPDEQKKQQIMFAVIYPTGGSRVMGKAHEHTLSCDAAGGTEWLKQIYPKAKWVTVHNLPHYYEYQASSVEEAQDLEKFIRTTTREKSMPVGCRYQDCELFKNTFDVCK